MNQVLLIVDDSPLLRRVIRKAATEAGFDESLIREAGHGGEALEAVEAEMPMAILLDINMPVMNGEEFLEEMNERKLVEKTAVFIVSTEVNARRLFRMAKLGAKGRLRKPFQPEELRKLLERATGKSA